MTLIHTSGGLGYHLRAWRYRQALWGPFHAQVAQWLSGWQTTSSHLLLVGPSGGYALNREFLARFRQITVIEPDPLARHILRRRFAQANFQLPHFHLPHFQFQRFPAFTAQDGFQQLAQRFPGTAILFCNLLGQSLVGQAVGPARKVWLSNLHPALIHHEWASWHDLATTYRVPDSTDPFALQSAVPLDQLIAHFWKGGEIEIGDHESEGIAPDQPREYAIWPIRPGQFHLIEWVEQGGGQGAAR